MNFTKEQISEQMRKHAEKENGLHDLMEMMLESMMVAERVEFYLSSQVTKAMVTVLVAHMVKVVN